MCPEILINPISDLRRKDTGKTCIPGRPLWISRRVTQYVVSPMFAQAKLYLNDASHTELSLTSQLATWSRVQYPGC